MRVFVCVGSLFVCLFVFSYMGTNRFTKDGGDVVDDDDEIALSGRNPPLTIRGPTAGVRWWWWCASGGGGGGGGQYRFIPRKIEFCEARR